MSAGLKVSENIAYGVNRLDVSLNSAYERTYLALTEIISISDKLYLWRCTI